MKKSTLLSLLTATSIVLTSAGTYALWDTTTTDTTTTVTFRAPVTVDVSKAISFTTKGDIGTTPSAEGTVKFNVSTGDGAADTLTIVPEVTGGSGLSASNFDFEISDTSGPLTKVNSGDSSEGFTDKTLDGESTEYTVKVTPKEGFKTEIGGKELTVKLTATLSKAE